MSKGVLISINPKRCELIASGRKTIELRKSFPKMNLPFKCYIYCTKGSSDLIKGDIATTVDYIAVNGGKVIGEFVCDSVLSHCEMANVDLAEQLGCVRREKILEYAKGKEVFGWHISDLVIYDKPHPLNWFVTEGDCDCMNCKKCSWFNRGNGYDVEDDCDLGYENIYRKKTLKPLFRPPQSWCYVEELDGEPNDRP